MCSRHPGGLTLSLLVLALLLSSCLLWSQQATGPLPTSPSQMQIISALKANLTQALALSRSLQASLQTRIASYQALSASYQALVQTQADLQQQIASLQANLQSSSQSLQQAQADLQTMSSQLQSLQASLSQASSSLASYKSDNDKAIQALEIQRNGWRIAGIVGVAVGVAGLIWGLAK